MRERLSNEQSANLATLQYLEKHPELLPEGWKGKYIYGWGTVVRNRSGNLLVPCLIERGGQVGLLWLWLGDAWGGRRPSLRCASTQTSEPENSTLNLSTLSSQISEISARVEELEAWKSGISNALRNVDEI
jgi:hypothetical protein